MHNVALINVHSKPLFSHREKKYGIYFHIKVLQNIVVFDYNYIVLWYKQQKYDEDSYTTMLLGTILYSKIWNIQEIREEILYCTK